MNNTLKILQISPLNAIPGGEIIIECEGFTSDFRGADGCYVDGEACRLVSASSNRIVAIVPESEGERSGEVFLMCGGMQSAVAKVRIGKRIAKDIHMVANPAVDPNDNSIILTRSGSRRQQLPVTLFRLEEDGYLAEMPVEFLNPTGLAFAASGQLFASNRAEGKVCRINKDGTVVPFAMDLGVATGIAFDKNSTLYVGDRGGTIYQIRGFDDIEVFATLEPSVAAYHLAFGPDGKLYVTAPGLSSFDNVWRIDEQGDAEIYYHGLGRPQGLAFDNSGNLYLAACLRGRRGIVKINTDREAEFFLAGMNVVGLCFTKKGEMIVATSDSAFSLPLGIFGTILDPQD